VGPGEAHGQSLWWPVVARNKKSVTLNLRTEEGQQVARDLLATSDLLIENFRRHSRALEPRRSSSGRSTRAW
jgi:formyl-CoA transferase